MSEPEAKKECAMLTKEIAHHMLHCLTPWQYLTRGKFWVCQYEKASRQLVAMEEKKCLNSK